MFVVLALQGMKSVTKYLVPDCSGSEKEVWYTLGALFLTGIRMSLPPILWQ